MRGLVRACLGAACSGVLIAGTAQADPATVHMYGSGTDADTVYYRLDIVQLSGSLHFENIKVNLVTDTVNDAAVYHSGTGSHTLQPIVADLGGATPVDTMDAWLVWVGSGDATFTLANGNILLDEGNYVYQLKERAATYAGPWGGSYPEAREWYLERVVEEPETPENPDNPDEPNTPPQPDTPVTPQPILSPSAQTVLLMTRAASQTAFYLGELEDLCKRLGDVRQQGREDGAWVSVVRNRTHLSGYRGTTLRNDAFRFNIGYDRKVSEDWLVGGYFHLINADQKADNTWNRSTGDSHSESFSLYATKLFDTGLYLDFVAGADRYHQNMHASMLDGTPVKGRYNNWGFGVSVEAGDHIKFGANDRWFFEPQAQLAYYRIKGDDFRLTNGMTVDQDDTDSLTGRAGFLLGRRILGDDGLFMGDVYLKAGLLHEFMGDQTLRLNGESFDADGLGTRWYYGIGGERYISRRGDSSFKLYGQFERQEGNRFTQDFEFRLGMKYVF